jgi:uncharacterized delta-60 repeat protein
VMFLLFRSLTPAETAVQAWVQRYNGPGNGDDYAKALAVDSANNVIVTGYSTNNASGNDYATIKYSSAGVPLWTNLYNGPGNGDDKAIAVAVDGSNNVIVTGFSTGSGGDYDYATITYSSAGVPVWTNRYNGPVNGPDVATAVSVDSSNNVIVVGLSPGSGSGNDYVTIKYSNAGVPLWTKRYNGPGNNEDDAQAVAVDDSNNVIVTGYSTGSGNSFGYLTIKYSSAGVLLWANTYDSPAAAIDYAHAVAVDGNNDVIVTGESSGTTSLYDYVTIKCSSAGAPLWTNRYDRSGGGASRARAVVVDSHNDVIITGYSDGIDSGYDYATVKYSSAGVPLWTNFYGDPGHFGDDRAGAVAVDRSDNVIVTGYSKGLGTSQDYATIKYSSAGVALWTNRYNGPGNDYDQACAVAVDHSGNVIVTGYSTNSASGYDFATIKYICTPSPVLTALQLTNGTFQTRVDGVSQPGTLVIEASTNLTGWAPVFTNTTPTNVLFYTDPDAVNLPTRFYRAFQFP